MEGTMLKKNFTILLLTISLYYPITTFAQLSAEHSGNKEVNNYIEEGMKLGETGRFNEAAESFNKAIALDSKNPKAHMLLGMAYLQLGQADKAIEYLNKSIELNPSNFEVYAPLSAAYQSIGKTAEAITCYTKFIDVCPDPLLKAQTYTLLGDLYKRNGEYEKAKDALNLAIKIFNEQGDEKNGKAIQMMKDEINNAELNKSKLPKIKQ